MKSIHSNRNGRFFLPDRFQFASLCVCVCVCVGGGGGGGEDIKTAKYMYV